ncbi:hypothetical protein B9Z55_026806 [Caenorhabditis nigoni]|uniref:Uncharacterized protein n=1 Tax=Caenorhabditis nigoni TaxID=1611254 RepID=A0A2G5SI03_9PELO|nr:hypothetical protein B9Z55_026806 [Caenorhabditis nigoni]
MSDRFKYSHNGICKIPNVRETIPTAFHTPAQVLFEVNNFEGTIFMHYWPGEKMVFPVVLLIRKGTSQIPSRIPLFLNILSNNPKFENEFKIETFAKRDDSVSGPEIPFSEVLNLENGFLDENGAMTIEYGFHFDAIFDEDQGMWTFNLESKLLDCELKNNMITYEKGEKMFYSHKQVGFFFSKFSLYIRIIK